MRTTFQTTLDLCGLSHVEAARYLDVEPEHVLRWAKSIEAPPDPVWIMLGSLWERINDAAQAAAPHLDLRQRSIASLGFLHADDPLDPLPEGSTEIAGAIALLNTISDRMGG